MTAPTRQSELHLRAHSIAIDRLCMNLLAAEPGLDGVSEEYWRALSIESELAERGK